MKRLFCSISRLALLLGVLFLYSCQKSLDVVSTTEQFAVVNVGDSVTLAASNLVADWETGNYNQWYGLSAAYPSSQYATVTWPVRQGKYAGKFVVHPGDYSFGERSELGMWTARSAPLNNYTQEVPGNDFYYGWSTMFPGDWKTPPGYCIFYQFQQRANYLNPAIAFNVYGETVQVNFSTGTVAGNSSSHTSSFAFMPTHNAKASPVILSALNRGKWHDFIVHVKFAPDATGIFEVWHRLEGSAGFTNVLSYRNVPTEPWTTNPATFIQEGVYTKYKVNNVYGCVPNTYVKLGLYRPIVSGNKIVNTIYHDNWTRQMSYAAVSAKFNASPVQPPPVATPAPPPVPTPTAKAGADATIHKFWNFAPLLNGSTSTIPGGWFTSAKWTKVSGPGDYVLANATAMQTRVKLPSVGVYTFRITVVTNGGATSSDDVSITVLP